MKTLITVLFFALYSFAFGASHYDVRSGKFHKGGKVTIETLSGPENFTVKLDYAIKKRSAVPISESKLRGETVIDLPVEFGDERGYLELENQKELKLSNADLKFVKRTQIENDLEAYELDIFPHNGKSKIKVFYHPSLPAPGWKTIHIFFISDISLLNGYQLTADLKTQEE